MQVIKTYSGKIGCMCGCRGKWNYTVYGAEHHAPGYKVTPNQRGAAIITKKVLNHPNRVLENGNIWVVEDRENNRIQAVYLG